ncbi:MAG: alpha/beta hydrolase [Hyphomicrobiales bacterium]|nr:MAG: alpha/beta hydrolase [Hyphomicrobiales bacterium]
MESEFVSINGNEFFVRLWGDASKPKLMLLHGFPEYGGAWEELAAYLCDDFYCIAPDLRGFGQSYKPRGVENYRMSLVVQDVIGLMAHYSPDEPIHLLAHDWGAAAAYVVASAVPNMISKLIILNGVHPIPFQAELAKGEAQAKASQYINWLRREDSADLLAADDFEKLINLLRQDMDSAWFDDRKAALYKTEWEREYCLEAMINWYKASPLKVPSLGQVLSDEDMVVIDAQKMRVAMPHLIIWGENDTALLVESRNGIFDLADDVRIVELEAADHWLHHQQSQKIAAEIRSFI